MAGLQEGVEHLLSIISSFSKAHIPSLCSAIVKSENVILEGEDREAIYSFVALSAHYIGLNVTQFGTSLQIIVKACKVLLKFVLLDLESSRESHQPLKKQQVSIIEGLCKGHGCLNRTEIVTLTAILKSANMFKDVGSTHSSPVENETGDSPSQGDDFFQRLQTAFTETTEDHANITKDKARVGAEKSLTSDSSSTDVKSVFSNCNVAALRQLRGGRVLLDLCLSFPEFAKIASKPAGLPQTVSLTSSSIQELSSELVIISSITSMPILEPLSASRVEKVCQLGLGCLDVALIVATGNFIIAGAAGTSGLSRPLSVKTPLGRLSLSKTSGAKSVSKTAGEEESLERCTQSIVENSINVFDVICGVISSSSRAGGQVLQNINMLAANRIITGLLPVLGLTAEDDKAKDNAAAKFKWLQGYNTLVVALASRGITLLSVLLEELQVEGLIADSEDEHVPVGADFSVNSSCSAWRRVKKLIDDLPLLNYLLAQFATLYKMATAMIAPSVSGGAASSRPSSGKSDSSKSPATSSDEGDSECISYSDGSSEDDEPLLGEWLRDTLSSTPSIASLSPQPTSRKKSEGADVGDSGSETTPTGRSFQMAPDEYMYLATCTLQFLTRHLLSSTVPDLTDYIRHSFTEEHMSGLVAVVKDLDKLSITRMENDVDMDKLCGAVDQTVHLLLVSDLLSNSQQDIFLGQIGLAPLLEGPWPLKISQRCLGILARVLLARQQRSLHTDSGMDIPECITVWNRLLNTLRDLSLQGDHPQKQDLNVEHLQLFLFIFHNFSMTQRKAILTYCAEVLIVVANSTSVLHGVPVAICRLLQLLDYFLHHLSVPPQDLFKQVQQNLFQSHTSASSRLSNDKGSTNELPIPLHYGAAGQGHELPPSSIKAQLLVDDSFSSSSNSQTLSPRFYELRPVLPGDSLDKEACSTLLSLSEQGQSYKEFHSAIVKMLMAGSLHKAKHDMGNAQTASLVATVIKQSFILTWRILDCLPPSSDFFKELSQDLGKQHVQVTDPDLSRLLCRLKFVSKLGIASPDVTYCESLKSNLVEQGMSNEDSQDIIEKVTKLSGNLHHSVIMTKQLLKEINKLQSEFIKDDIPSKLPGFLSLCVLDAVIGKTHVALNDSLCGNTHERPDLTLFAEYASELLPVLLDLISLYQRFAEYCCLSGALKQKSSDLDSTESLQAYSSVIKIGFMRLPKHPCLSLTFLAGLPSPVKKSVEKWNNIGLANFPATSLWKTSCLIEVETENFLDTLVSAHLQAMCSDGTRDIAPALKHTLLSLIQLAADLLAWSPKEEHSMETALGLLLCDKIVPLLVDATTEYLSEHCNLILERVVGPADSDKYASCIQSYVLSKCHDLLVEQCTANGSDIGEEVLIDCLKYMDLLLDKVSDHALLDQLYSQNKALSKIIILSANKRLSLGYVNRTLKLAVRILQLAEKPLNSNMRSLCSGFSELCHANRTTLDSWLRRIILGVEEDKGNSGKMADNRLLLQTFATHIVKESSPVGEEVSHVLLECLIPLGNELLPAVPSEWTNIGSKFGDLLNTAAVLASAGDGSGHLALCAAVIEWLEKCKTQLLLVEANSEKGKESGLVEAAGPLLRYLAELMTALKYFSEKECPPSPSLCTGDGDSLIQDVDSDWMDDMGGEDEDSGGEESDEDSLCNKLCTFTVTQKEFMNQHWYHCHTCKMNDGVGVCTVCAKVCHKDHDISYAKYGSFFCDCGAKEDGSCIALVKRMPSSGAENQSTVAPSPFASGETDEAQDDAESSLSGKVTSATTGTSSSTGTAASGLGGVSAIGNIQAAIQEPGAFMSKSVEALAKQLEKHKQLLVSQLEKSSVVGTTLDLLQWLMGSGAGGPSSVGIGVSKAITNALNELHSTEKSVENTDQLMVPTLGSQEGAFENVRMTFSGEQGQTIRQLIGAHVLRRIAMCCLASPKGRRQHLAVSHEKGKITVLQLSALLKQADSSKRKLTLTRLATAQVPFTVLTIAGNSCNEDFLAVCGLKDCHVLTFSSSGSVVDHLALHPQLETGNFIIKAVWLPGSQTQLALVTADFVKIYDLSQDALSPLYYFLLPSGKIRDVSFIFDDGEHSLILMSSGGQLYLQPMDDNSSAINGPFYLTNTVPIEHPDLEDSSGQVAGGGVSVYYSHILQLIFFSYSQGKTFVAPWSKNQKKMKNMFPVTFKSSSGGNKNSQSAALCQWSEVPQHPGLVCCLTHAGGVPVVLMVKPHQILIQEIKATSSKAKTQDMVAIRHSVSTSDQQRTTMILLCEDGSLRIYMASAEHTGYWMSPEFQPTRPLSIIRPARKKKASKTRVKSTTVNFPVDFFEHCQALNEVEFGGGDILQVYNVQQAKHRLLTAGMYIASTKPNGFNIEITNTNLGVVMVGVRILIGCQSVEKAPSFVEIFGRVIQLSLTRNRWFDLPFTREESLSADKKFSLFIGQSLDPSGVTMLDSVKVYSKTKEAFGWPDDPQEEIPPTPGLGPAATVDTETEIINSVPAMTAVDKLVVHLLEVVDGCFSTFISQEEMPRQSALQAATSLMTSAMPSAVQHQAQALLATLHPSKASYHSHKDQAQLSQVVSFLCKLETPFQAKEGSSGETDKELNKTGSETNQTSVNANDLDVESFQRFVVSSRSVASTRPSNLAKYTTLPGQATADEGDDSRHFAVCLMNVFWKLHSCQPVNPSLSPLSSIGLQHVESTVTALVDIIHAFAIADPSKVSLAVKQYVRMLLCEDQSVSFACKQALMRLIHKHWHDVGNSPPQCNTPTGEGVGGDDFDGEEDDADRADRTTPEETSGTDAEGQRTEEDQPDAEAPETAQQEPDQAQPDQASGAVSSIASAASHLEALLLGAGGLPGMLDLPADADDEAMMELAIALSLQEQAGAQGLSLQGLPLPGVQSQSLPVEVGASSDNASGQGSEDEYDVPPCSAQGSSAGHSAPRSPLPHDTGHTGGEFESGSSVDSVAAEPGTSMETVVLESDQAGTATGQSDCGSNRDEEQGRTQEDKESLMDQEKLHSLKLLLLDELLLHLPQLKDVGGVQAIPFMQVLRMLCSDLEDNERDKVALNKVLSACLSELKLDQMQDVKHISSRTKQHEVWLILMRLLSVLMSRTKSLDKNGSESSSLVCKQTAATLCDVGITSNCLKILKTLLEHWRDVANQEEEETSGLGGALLKPQPASPPPDMSPFFLRQYVKGHAGDVFEAYPQLLTEMALRLPYQVKKVADSLHLENSPQFGDEWYQYLCEYLLIQQTPFVRRQVRKLLLFLCGSKESYRRLRDLHALKSHMKTVRELSEQGGFSYESVFNGPISLPYDTLITLIEHLKACSEIASSRISNWQEFCLEETDMLPFLLRSSFLFEEGVTPLMLQLLGYAICEMKTPPSSSPQKGKKDKKDEKEKSKSKEKDKDKDKDKEKTAAAQCLVQLLSDAVDEEVMSQFVQNFLLESNSTAVRWQAHELLFSMHKYSNSSQKIKLSNMMWKIWPYLPDYGRRAAQFVDLLGYFTIKCESNAEELQDYCVKAVQVLMIQNNVLSNHPNSNVYRMLSGYVEFDGYYLESDPCLVCNNPEVPFQSLKLSNIKGDSRFTTTCQLVKLIGSHTISRVTLRIADLKRQKMVRTINLYYNNRTVQAVVELKNKRSLWHKAKKCHLSPGQTELKVDFPLPIVACNLMIEYADFYENFQASSETLQCPRCSASVNANPGVCSNCGENVYQCHKCRSINYDERDPFLCNACGFCKYAKFDYTLTARPCCAVDPIENEEDRKKAVANINSLLERADRVYRQLVSHRQPLDLLLNRLLEHGQHEPLQEGTSGGAQTVSAVVTGSSAASAGSSSSSSAGVNTGVNKAIQALAHRYCVECKGTFDELSKITQKVLASRKELLEYDCRESKSVLETTNSGSLLLSSGVKGLHGECYGCASAAIEHCVTLLRALAMVPGTRKQLVEEGLIQELVDFNLHEGTAQMRNDVRHLLCLLTKDNEHATMQLNEILISAVGEALSSHKSNPAVVSGISREMLLLNNAVEMEDSCWEMRLRCVMTLFMMSVEVRSPLIMETITVPCLKILLRLVKPTPPSSKANKDKDCMSLGSVQGYSDVRIKAKQWMDGDTNHTYSQWKALAPKKSKEAKEESRDEARKRHLMEKYGRKWQEKTRRSESSEEKETPEEEWLRQVLFTPSNRAARQMACTMIESLCQIPSRQQHLLDLLTSYLEEVRSAGENAAEFFQLYQRLTQPTYWKFYLALQGALLQIGQLVTKEIEHLTYLEQYTLSSDLSQGYALKMLAELMSSFLEHEGIKQKFKGRLVATVLNGYLSLRRLVVQRTKLIDETQEILLELLEEMTTGTETETKAFMAICVETLKRYGLDDLRTPVFIFERLCNLIFPEENDVGEFFLTLEKDPQQEDFLQGRMQGNPYSCNEPGLGPLMRDVKNKICTDCELVALLEDDSGMELLVNSKIISLDLPVKDVYKKIWCPEGEGEPMRIIYRMRGLLGDATEEFVENLDTQQEEELDDEEVYKMASIMSSSGGLEAMLSRLSGIKDLVRGKQLVSVILKLMGYCVKLKVNRHYLCLPTLNTLNVLLGTLNQALQLEADSGGGASIAEDVLGIMETVLQEATSTPSPAMPVQQGDGSQLDMLLDRITSPYVRTHSSVLQAMMRIIPFLTFGDEGNMRTLVNHFLPYLDFEKFDRERSSDEVLFFDCFCSIASKIENNHNGFKLKELIIENGIVAKALKYLEKQTPQKPFSKANLLEADVWKEFLARPSLPYVLRLLTGLCKGHETTQILVGKTAVPAIHRLEQVSSEEKVGSLAENLMEALRDHPDVEKKVSEVRRSTRLEKKKLAMAMREKQLGALGMETTSAGKIIAKPSSMLREMEELHEESGLACCICREGYKYHPQKVLGIYTFTKRCILEEFENKQRKTQGYSTVSHFNIVHYDCHMAAVRLARGRDEWESAALQNANTKCNGLLPIWGPQVSESAFASCLARHNSYIQECTGHLEPTYHASIHDLRLLLQRFAFEKSFSEDTGGGGRDSNIKFVPYAIHMILYVLNTTRQLSREEKTLKSFLDMSADKWAESSYEVDSPLYSIVLSLFVYSLEQWNQVKITFLKRLIITAHARHLSPTGTSKILDTTPLSFAVYRPYMVLFVLIDKLHHLMKKHLAADDSGWPQGMLDHIRNSDETVLKGCDKILSFYQTDLLPSESVAELFDVAGMLPDIPQPDSFIAEVLSLLPK
ncbi:E3 ubiquitin-protein ligase UBR4-like isoform X2 [Montipora foliosa]|uniref:E3 ubiquitin-protein ligase UBR4-like isoform X2 n=1 Tax=Montipora foliosa TaxID=591990 RepID=UPI0035F157E2